MPAFATLSTNVPCKTCGIVVDGPVSFQWGEIPSRYSALGEAIRWAKADGKIIRPFRLFPGKKWNFGDPLQKNVIVFDSDRFTFDACFVCPSCSSEIYIAVHIRDNVLANLESLTRGDLERLLGLKIGIAECITVSEDGQHVIRDDFWERIVPFNPDGPVGDDLLSFS